MNSITNEIVAIKTEVVMEKTEQLSLFDEAETEAADEREE